MFESLGWKTVNPGQDYDDLETQAINPNMQTLRPNVYISRRHHDASNITASAGSPLMSSPNGDNVLRQNSTSNDTSNNYHQPRGSLSTAVESPGTEYTCEEK